MFLQVIFKDLPMTLYKDEMEYGQKRNYDMQWIWTYQIPEPDQTQGSSIEFPWEAKFIECWKKFGQEVQDNNSGTGSQ